MFKYHFILTISMGKLKFLLMDIILLIVFLGIVDLIITTKRFFFIGEFLFIVIALLLGFIGLLGFSKEKKWSATILYFIFMLITINTLIFYYIGRKSMVTLLLSTLGMLIALAHIKREGDRDFDFEESTVHEEFTPGKYVASKSGKTYHAPKCDWALKIKEANRVWFDSDAEAKKSKYKKHSCLE